MSAAIQWCAQNPRLAVVAGVFVVLCLAIVWTAIFGAAERSDGRSR